MFVLDDHEIQRIFEVFSVVLLLIFVVQFLHVNVVQPGLIKKKD